jgi:transcriptional regulatory protein LevR
MSAKESADLFKPKDIYAIIERRIGEMNRVGASRQQIDEVMGEIMADYYNGFSADTGASRLESFVGTEIVSTVDKMLEIATRELGRNFDAKLRYGLSLHLNNAIRRTLQGLPITNPRLDSIQSQWPEILAAAQKMLALIEQDFNIRLPPDEAGFITLFLGPRDGLAAAKIPLVEVIVIAHGRGIATGLAETANQFLDTDIIRGFDVSLDENQSETYQKVKTYLEQQGEISGVLFLVDMGSLVNYAYEFEQELRLHTRCISMVSTLHVLEAGRKALMGYSLEDVYESTRQLTARVSSENHNTLPEGFSQRNFLLTVCTTGEGSAQVLKTYLSKKPDMKDGQCSIIPLQITDTQEFNRHVERLRAEGRIIGTISALPVNIPGPQFQLSTAMTPEGISEIQKLIDTETVFIQACRNMADTLTGFKNSIVWEIRNMMDRIKENLRTEMDSDMLIGIFCHIGCTLDRIKSGEKVLEFPKKQTIAEKYPRELGFIRRECAGLSKLCGMNIPADEAYYILILFKKENWL